MAVQEEKKSIAEWPILIRVPIELKLVVEELQKENINGRDVEVRTQAQVVREAFMRGLQEMKRDKGIRL